MNDEKTFTVSVTVRKCPTNEVEGDLWFDPDDFVNFLKRRYVLDRDAKYGLDAYNKHAGQHIVNVDLIH